MNLSVERYVNKISPLISLLKKIIKQYLMYLSIGLIAITLLWAFVTTFLAIGWKVIIWWIFLVIVLGAGYIIYDRLNKAYTNYNKSREKKEFDQEEIYKSLTQSGMKFYNEVPGTNKREEIKISFEDGKLKVKMPEETLTDEKKIIQSSTKEKKKINNKKKSKKKRK